jgi:hypothetical protein
MFFLGLLCLRKAFFDGWVLVVFEVEEGEFSYSHFGTYFD